MTIWTEILKAHTLVVQKKLKAEDFDAMLLGIASKKNRRVNYYEYIQSPEWKKKAEAAKKAAGYRCQICNRHKSEVQLDAHHRTYERLWHEDPKDITVLCHDCHELYETNK